MKPLGLVPLLALLSPAVTRTVLIEWTPAPGLPGGVAVTFEVLRCRGADCTPALRLNSRPIAGTRYADSTAVVGDTYRYRVEEWGPVCASSSGPSSLPLPCGLLSSAETDDVLIRPPSPVLAQILLPIVGGRRVPGTPSAPVIVSMSPLPGAVLSMPYSFQFTADGTQPITWTATGVPAGLTLSAGGLLSGSPSASGTSTINVTATNSVGSAGPAPFSLTVGAPGPITALTCNQPDVNAVINGPTHTAIDGDTINIPAGNCTWTTGIVVPSGIGISIIGAGAASTTIIDNYAVLPRPLFFFQPVFGSSVSRVSGMTLSPMSGLAANSLFAPVAAQGTCTAAGCPNVRIDNLVFPGSPDWGGLTRPSGTMMVVDNVFGVIDHNSLTQAAGNPMEFVNANLSAFLGVGQYGDNSWASPTNWGSSQALFIENNTLSQIGTSSVMPLTESEGSTVGNTGAIGPTAGGFRAVCRFNTLVGLRNVCVNHGTESNGRSRGGRSIEFYDNSVTCLNNTYRCFTSFMQQGVGARSGSVMMAANNWNWIPGTGLNNFAGIVVYRATKSFLPWGPCDGTSNYDLNDPTVYYSDTIGGVSGTNPYTIAVSGTPNWTTGQWTATGSNAGQPFSIHDSTINDGIEINANGSNTLSTVNAFSSIPFAVGDSIQIRRAFQCLDQSSRSGGSLFSGNPAVPDNTSGTFVYQTLDPVYEAADTATGGLSFGPVTSGTARMVANRDFFAEVSQSAQTSPTSPFNGTVGTGYGVLANRPTTCTPGNATGAPGVGYWATDQGSWNTSGSGGQGQLYVCSALNTWTLYYTPYTYPHPLDH